MKKTSLFICLILILVISSACTNDKTLSCTKDYKKDEYDISESRAIKYTNDKITFIEAEIRTTLTEDKSNLLETAVKSAEENLKKYNGHKDIAYSVETEDLTLIVKLTSKTISISNDLKDIFGLSTSTYKNDKNHYQDNGFTCK